MSNIFHDATKTLELGVNHNDKHIMCLLCNKKHKDFIFKFKNLNHFPPDPIIQQEKLCFNTSKGLTKSSNFKSSTFMLTQNDIEIVKLV